MRTGAKEPMLVRVWLRTAQELAQLATCERASHGCVLTPPDLSTIVGVGYNGPASGLPNQCARPLAQGNCGCVHAEMNACIKAPPGPKWAFITMQPCERCAGALINAGVECVVYGDGAHRTVTEGTQLLDQLGIPHGSPDDIIEMMLADQAGTPHPSRFAEEWDEYDFLAAKRQASKFVE